jgi:5-methylcytosine-specific restriction endonuclease McrA
MNNIIKALLGTSYKSITPSSNTTLQKPQILIDVNPKPPRKPKSTVSVVPKKQTKVSKSEDAITEKEIQAAMKRIKKVEAEARKRLAEEELKTQSITKNVVPKASPKKKQPIPNHVKTLIWNHWVGCDKAETFCLCCKVTKISIRSFHAGHIVAESKGGDMTVKNLKPICGPCNLSMGSMNMDEFIKKFGLGK